MKSNSEGNSESNSEVNSESNSDGNSVIGFEVDPESTLGATLKQLLHLAIKPTLNQLK